MTRIDLLLFCSLVLFFSCCNTPVDQVPDPPPVIDSLSKPGTAAASARPVHWGYDGELGPQSWGTLSPVYALCGNGQGQSPIDLRSGTTTGDAKWQFNYGTSSLMLAHNEHVEDLIDNGHTLQVSVEEGSSLTLDGSTYALRQFHFHTPSEHTVDGEHMPMEMHLVHADPNGSLAVVSIMVKEGKANPNLAKLIEHMPVAPGDTVHVTDRKLELKAHLPSHERAYHYVGSLTTPPCSENVQWLVLSEPVTASKEQIDAFAVRMRTNNRPVQQLNARSVSKVDLTAIAR